MGNFLFESLFNIELRVGTLRFSKLGRAGLDYLASLVMFVLEGRD